MDISRFDLNLLRSLDALLTEQNVTRAAERLFVTQQAASGALHRLRDHFADELLTRVGRHLELTPLALSLKLPVREALLAAQVALEARPMFEPATATGSCRIAMSDFGIFVLLPRFLQRLTAQAPGVRCLVEPVTPESFSRLVTGDLDFCMTAHDWRLYGITRPSPDIRSEPMFYEDFVCVADGQHVDVEQGISLEAYIAHRHNSVVFGHGIATIVERAWSAAGIDIEISATAPSFSSQIFMLPGTPLVATAQRRLAALLAPTLGLSVVECPMEVPTLQENLMWHKRSELHPKHEFLRDLLKASGAELEAGEGGASRLS